INTAFSSNTTLSISSTLLLMEPLSVTIDTGWIPSNNDVKNGRRLYIFSGLSLNSFQFLGDMEVDEQGILLEIQLETVILYKLIMK
ncbi:24005_t:CDS:2, partial [Dentiscutata erythropus]